MLNQVFISYRRENEEHNERVRWLAGALRSRGLNVIFDEFYLEEKPEGPDEKWSRWCIEQAKESACVLIVGSAGWYTAFEHPEGAESSGGLGAAAEANVIQEQLYRMGWNTSRHRVVLLDPGDESGLPEEIGGWLRFAPNSKPADLDNLIRWATQATGVGPVAGVRPQTSWPTQPAPFKYDLADRAEREWPAVLRLLTAGVPVRILVFEGPSGYSKSALLSAAARYAKTLPVPTAYVDFKDTKLLTETNVLRELQLGLVDALPAFSQMKEPDRWSLRRALRALQGPVLILLDTYENAAETKDLVEWIETQLLGEVEEYQHLRFIIGGQKVPDITRYKWRDYAELVELDRILDKRVWQYWVHERNPNVDEKHVEAIVGGLDGVPGSISKALLTFAESLRISRHLAEQDPSNAGWQRDLAVALISRVGDVLQAQRRLQGRQEAAFGESLRISRQLAEQDPSNAGWQRGLALACLRAARLEAKAKRHSAALPLYDEASRIFAALSERAPGIVQWAEDRAIVEAELTRCRSRVPG